MSTGDAFIECLLGHCIKTLFKNINTLNIVTFDPVVNQNNVNNKTKIVFDKVICLTRENSVEAAISFIVARNSNYWHVDYEVSNNWILENRNEIILRKNRYDYMKSILKKLNTLQIKYENVYIDNSHLESIMNYLNIYNPKHLDMLSYDKKYRKDTHSLVHDFDRKNII
jgi:LPS sulfotransferase NodH